MDHDALERSNRLLGAYIREVLGEEPLTMPGVFGTLAPRAGTSDP